MTKEEFEEALEAARTAGLGSHHLAQAARKLALCYARHVEDDRSHHREESTQRSIMWSLIAANEGP